MSKEKEEATQNELECLNEPIQTLVKCLETGTRVDKEALLPILQHPFPPSKLSLWLQSQTRIYWNTMCNVFCVTIQFPSAQQVSTGTETKCYTELVLERSEAQWMRLSCLDHTDRLKILHRVWYEECAPYRSICMQTHSSKDGQLLRSEFAGVFEAVELEQHPDDSASKEEEEEETIQEKDDSQTKSNFIRVHLSSVSFGQPNLSSLRFVHWLHTSMTVCALFAEQKVTCTFTPVLDSELVLLCAQFEDASSGTILYKGTGERSFAQEDEPLMWTSSTSCTRMQEQVLHRLVSQHEHLFDLALLPWKGARALFYSSVFPPARRLSWEDCFVFDKKLGLLLWLRPDLEIQLKTYFEDELVSVSVYLTGKHPHLRLCFANSYANTTTLPFLRTLLPSLDKEWISIVWNAAPCLL